METESGFIPPQAGEKRRGRPKKRGGEVVLAPDFKATYKPRREDVPPPESPEEEGGEVV